MRQSLRHYRKNVEGLPAPLEAVTAVGVTQFVFSSSAAAHWAPDLDQVDERTRELEPVAIGTVVAQERVLDRRNAVDREAWTAAGWTYGALGRRAG